MAYFIKSGNGLDLPSSTNIILQTISTLKYKGSNYRTRKYDPVLMSSEAEKDVYNLGRIIDPIPGRGFDTLIAVNVKHPNALGDCFSKIASDLDFFPNWIIMCGIESAHGFDLGPLHKNLDNERIFEAIQLGKRIKKEIQGVENLVFVHYYIDNRDIIPHVEKID